MAIDTLLKQPAESLLFEIDLVRLLAAGEEISGVTSVSASPAGLTLSGAATYGGTVARQRIAGGTTGKLYKVTFVVTTTSGNTRSAEGLLQVRDL